MSYPTPGFEGLAYPEPTYHGATGEVSARLRRADHPAELDTGGGGAAHYLATGVSTAGHFGLYRWDMGPQQAGPAPHFHRTFSESFFVLTGRPRLYDGEEWLEAAPGDFCFVPAGGVHGFRNDSGEPASMLILFAPGAPREAYFEGLVEMFQPGRQVSAEEFQEFCERHDNLYV